MSPPPIYPIPSFPLLLHILFQASIPCLCIFFPVLCPSGTKKISFVLRTCVVLNNNNPYNYYIENEKRSDQQPNLHHLDTEERKVNQAQE